MRTEPAGNAGKERRARDYLAGLRWPDGARCPSCGSAKVRRMGGRTQPGMFQCNACRRKFGCRTGTIMARSHVSFADWLAAERLLRSKGGRISASRLMRELDLGSYRTARTLRRLILTAMRKRRLHTGAPVGSLLVTSDANASAADSHWTSAHQPPPVSRIRRGSNETRSIQRAIDLLEHLTHGPLTLPELQRASSLPETTLRRIVKTLIDRKMIRIGLSDRKLRLNIAMLAATSPALVNKSARLIASADEAMRLLSTRIHLQVDLHVFEENRMVRVESTHRGPFPSGVPVEFELNMFAAASGLAFLSTLADDRVLQLVRECEAIPRLELSRYGISPSDLLRELVQIRAQGFAVRRVTQMWPDTFQGIAVPIVHGSRCVGCLSIQWPSELISISFIRRRFLSLLKASATQVEMKFALLEGPGPSRMEQAPPQALPPRAGPARRPWC